MLTVFPDDEVPRTLRGAVVAIGNFDGVHLGHQILFEVARKRALDLGAAFAVLTFDPHPRAFFKPDAPPFLLTPAPLKAERFAACKADGMINIRFDRALADLTPQAFIDSVLKDRLAVGHVVIGRDFHFGHARAGTAETLIAAGIPVTQVDVMGDASGVPYSSTRIRALLQNGEMTAASHLLGWDWVIDGTVVHGDKRGRELGYPTANIPLADRLHPAYGIYAGLVRIGSAPPWYQAALNIGIRPMFTTRTALLEAHLLDFNGDLYGQTLRVRPVLGLREEARFTDIESLKAQMQRDCTRARGVLADLAKVV